MQRAALAGNLGGIFPRTWWVLGYAVVLFAAAVWFFLRPIISFCTFPLVYLREVPLCCKLGKLRRITWDI